MPLGLKLPTWEINLQPKFRRNWNEVFEAWNETHYITEGFPSFTDLREFVKMLQQKPGLSQINLITQAGDEVFNAFNAAMPFTKCYLKKNDHTYGGLTIHFPQQEQHFTKLSEYDNLKFKDTNWHNFLRIFIENTQGGGGGGGGVGADEIGLAGSVTFPGQQLSPYCYVFIYEVDNQGKLTQLGYEEVEADGSFSILVQGVAYDHVFAFDAFDDANNNEQVDIGEGLGYWDGNGNNAWDDVLEAQPGHEYSGINISLTPYQGKAKLTNPGFISQPYEMKKLN